MDQVEGPAADELAFSDVTQFAGRLNVSVTGRLKGDHDLLDALKEEDCNNVIGEASLNADRSEVADNHSSASSASALSSSLFCCCCVLLVLLLILLSGPSSSSCRCCSRRQLLHNIEDHLFRPWR